VRTPREPVRVVASKGQAFVEVAVYHDRVEVYERSGGGDEGLRQALEELGLEAWTCFSSPCG
jgi:hypothetical protein